MSVISLALSATEPGTWTFAATVYKGTETLEPADDYGNPIGGATSQEYLTSGGPLSLLDEEASDVVQQDVLTYLIFGGTQLRSASGLVTITSSVNVYGAEVDLSSSTQTITADGPWNLIKDIAASALSTEALTISNFVDVQVDTGTDPGAHDINVEEAKRGSITALGSQENVSIDYLSNEYTWSNTFDVKLGDGSNTFVMAPLLPGLAQSVQSLTPMTFNTAPQDTLLQLQTGKGQNLILTRECSASIVLGTGVNTLEMTDGHNEVWTSGGQDNISIFSHSPSLTAGMATDIGTDLIHLGTEAANVFLDDSNLATMPVTTVEIGAPDARESAPESSGITYGHYASGESGTLEGGNWTHLTIDLHGFAAGSQVSLFQQPIDGYSVLSVRDASSGALRVVDLNGGAPSLDQLHIVWS